MSDTSPNLTMPYLAPAQAQKHVTVNQALARLDGLVQMRLVSRTVTAEPSSPNDGDLYALPAGATGANWSGMSTGALAYYHDGAWEGLTPKSGWRASILDEGGLFVFLDGDWRAAPRTDQAQTWTGAQTVLHNFTVSLGVSSDNASLPAGNWAASIGNRTNGAAEHGLLVFNRWATDASTVFAVGGVYDAGDGFDTFFSVSGGGTGVFQRGLTVQGAVTLSSDVVVSGTLAVEYGVHANAIGRPAGDWAGVIANENNTPNDHGLMVANRWVTNDTTVLSVGNLSYDDYVPFFEVRGAGELRHKDRTLLDFDGAIHLKSHTISTLPSAAPAGKLVYLSDGASNKRLAISDGTVWRYADGAAV